MDNFDM